MTEKRKRMTKQEKEEWDSLYEFVRSNVLGYDKSQSLSKQMCLRLKGLKTNKFMENKSITDTADYSYNTILNTFKFCNADIQKGLRTHSFNDENHKFNYIIKIIENNINTVYLRMQRASKAEQEALTMDMSVATHTGAAYQRKTGKCSKRQEAFW